MPFSDLAELNDAICARYHCESRHLLSSRPSKSFADRMAWQGVVELFALSGCDRAERCYAWSYREDGRTRIATVLASESIDSADAAVTSFLGAKQPQKMRRLV